MQNRIVITLIGLLSLSLVFLFISCASTMPGRWRGVNPRNQVYKYAKAYCKKATAESGDYESCMDLQYDCGMAMNEIMGLTEDMLTGDADSLKYKAAKFQVILTSDPWTYNDYQNSEASVCRIERLIREKW